MGICDGDLRSARCRASFDEFGILAASSKRERRHSAIGLPELLTCVSVVIAAAVYCNAVAEGQPVAALAD
jgi:hypothetical protein